MLDGILIIALGLISASSIIASFNKDAEGLIKTLAQFQGWIGLAGFGWGVWGVIRTVLNLGWIGTNFFWWVTLLATSVIMLVLGFICGFGLISQYTMKGNEEVEAKAKDLLEKLNPYKTTLGLIGLGVGVWAILYDLVLYSMLN
jgi:magnesium-transporting ATPase (P-type)